MSVLSLFFVVCVAVSGAVAALPTNFDARTHWPSCGWFILNQEQCGSCWDFCSVESFADRLCITGEAPAGTIISPEPILECSSQGCNGGFPATAWSFMNTFGITTCTNQCYGGCAPYDSGSGRSPYCHFGTCDSGYSWPATYYSGAYQQLPAGSISYIQQELYNYGPLQACYTVYENFYSFFESYPTGIYSQASGNVVGGHCVKLIGWGVQNNVPYWLFANSWDYNFADGGYFKMLRGYDLCGIEDVITEGFTQRQSVAAGIKGVQPNITKMMVGGWHEQNDLNSEFIRNAAVAAVELVSKKLEQEFNLEKVVSAETQVVAGVNFRLLLGVQNGRALRVVLHRSLKNEYSIMEHQLQ